MGRAERTKGVQAHENWQQCCHWKPGIKGQGCMLRNSCPMEEALKLLHSSQGLWTEPVLYRSKIQRVG
jgi:hypothetical protein